MNVTNQQAEKLLTGAQKFNLYAFSMMLTHLKEVYSKDPSQLTSCTADINAFLDKYKAIMVKDFELLETL